MPVIEEIELGGFYPDMDAIANKLNEIIAVVNQLAPALPEEPENEDKGTIYVDEADIVQFLKTVEMTCAGKKIKIKVIKK